MNSKFDASFFVELLAWRAKILAKKYHQNTSIKASKFVAQNRPVYWVNTRGDARAVTRPCLQLCVVLCLVPC